MRYRVTHRSAAARPGLTQVLGVTNMAKAGSLILKIMAGVLVWIFVSGIAALTLWPSLPNSSNGWVFLLVLGPPLYLLAEWVGEAAWNSKPGKALSEHSSRPFRMLVLVVLGLLFVMASVVVSNSFFAGGNA